MSWFRKRNKSTGKEELGDVEFDDINFKGATKIYELEGTCELGVDAYLTLKQGGEFNLKANTAYYYEAQSIGISITDGLILAYTHFGALKRYSYSSMINQDDIVQAYEGFMTNAECLFEVDPIGHRLRVKVTDSLVRTIKWKTLLKIVEVTI